MEYAKLSLPPFADDSAPPLLADCVAISEALIALNNEGVAVSFFTSTDQLPEIWLKPTEELRQFSVGKNIIKSPRGVHYLLQIEFNGVQLFWLEKNYGLEVFNL